MKSGEPYRLAWSILRLGLKGEAVKLPSHKYYSLEKAAMLAGCEVSDLIHFAAIGVLELCTKIPQIELFINHPKDKDAEPELLKVESNSSFDMDMIKIRLDAERKMEESAWLESSIKEYDDETETYAHWLRFSYRSDYFSMIERYNVLKDIKEIERWDGMLAIPQAFIESNERELAEWDDWEVSVCELNVPRCESVCLSPRYDVDEFFIDNWYEVSRKDIYITSYEFNLLINGGKDICDRDCRDVPLHHGVRDTEPVSPNKRSERHAINRESLLKSAIFILSHYPEECRGERKEISPEKWRDCLIKHRDELPPLMITNEDVILRHLRNAANGRGNS